MRKQVDFSLACLICSLFLTNVGCGWQVRGNDSVSRDVGKIWLESEDQQQPLLQDLTQALKKSGIILSKRKKDANYIIAIIEHRSNRKIGTYNSGLRAAEYRLFEEVDFVISNSGGVAVTALSTASVERVFHFIEQDVMASSFEERSLKFRMQLEIARQIISHLRTAHGKYSKLR
ncbi:MAG: hypothetical protein CBC09_03035 [Cellvibrionales bacterium TMED49]|nr:hypothetical protein [Porticoccaceae bacterium]OUU39200.1 MAG: hypothetical protein CBC09_03035 [Cellvibrionales bacterium TMED49]|tara:strand:+ start:1224 stop:1748 length:525 start_codon:yes stop_codon:yes gene_type:complete